jgi:outer membrane receptor for ferrienterochelin and colicins
VKNFEITAGYQFLLSGDKAIMEKIESNKVYGRNSPLGSARLMTLSDYSGLYNRS